jgi:hypothetical protein
MFHALLIAFFLLAGAAAQEIMGAWNLQSPPTCSGLTATVTYTKNFGQSDYQFTITWGDGSVALNETRTVEDGETVTYSYTYPAAGSYQIFAQAFVVSFQTEVSNAYYHTLTSIYG